MLDEAGLLVVPHDSRESDIKELKAQLENERKISLAINLKLQGKVIAIFLHCSPPPVCTRAQLTYIHSCTTTYRGMPAERIFSEGAPRFEDGERKGKFTWLL